MTRVKRETKNERKMLNYEKINFKDDLLCDIQGFK